MAYLSGLGNNISEHNPASGNQEQKASRRHQAASKRPFPPTRSTKKKRKPN
ncbi:MAG: hypothetical protein PHQ34_12965 [Methanothrix sp.]|nr:hypothetical protein [Methanothrix sp.]